MGQCLGLTADSSLFSPPPLPPHFSLLFCSPQAHSLAHAHSLACSTFLPGKGKEMAAIYRLFLVSEPGAIDSQNIVDQDSDQTC